MSMKQIGVVCTLILVFLWSGRFRQHAYATDCVAIASLTGVTYTVNQSCAFGPNQPGFDTGTETTNTSIMNITGQGVVITIDRHIGVGSATLPDTASIAIGTGGSISLGASLWVTDQDGDTYAVDPAVSPVGISRTQPAGTVRLSSLSGHTSYDCCDSSNLAYPGAATACTATALTGCTPAGGQYDYNCDGTSSKTGCTACYAQSGGQLYCRSNCSAYYYTGSQVACGASGKLRGAQAACYPYDARGDCTADTGFEVVTVYKVGSSCTQGCR